MLKNNKKTKKINVHIYPTDMLHEARIKKIVNTINSIQYFDHIYLLGINRNGELAHHEKLNEKISIIRFPIDSNFWIKASFFKKIFSIIEFWLFILNFLIKNKPEVVNAHNLASLPPCIFYKVFYKHKIVYDTHELETERTGWSMVVKKIAKLFESFCIKFVNEIVVVNEPYAEYYKKKYNLDSLVVYNTPNYSQIKKNKYLHGKFNIRRKDKVFIYIGALSKNRGIEEYLDFFDNTKLNISLVFLGSGPLRDLIKKFELKKKNIYLHPPVNHLDVPKIISSADFSISVLRSRKTSLSYEYAAPNKLFESIMAGVPILSGGLKFEAEFVTNNNIGMPVNFDKFTPDIGSSIKKLIKLDYKLLEENCKKLSKIYNWENQEVKIKNYMLHLLNINN
jgi:hypothetical protein